MEQEQRFWDQNTGQETAGDVFENIPEGTTSIYVNGAYVDVSPGEPFVDTILQAAKNARLGKFRVYNAGGIPGFRIGDEIEPDDDRVPETFDEGARIELRPYDEASETYWSV
jgi:hypothetical protein